MKPAAFELICRELTLAPKDLAGVLGVTDADAIRLWSKGGVPIPGPIVKRVQRLVQDWRHANEVAQQVIATRIEPTLGQGDTPPKTVALTLYDARSIVRLKSEEPGITLSMHNLVNRAVAMKLAKMNVPVSLTVIAEDDYAAWLGDRLDGKDSRAIYARDVAKAHPLGLPLSASPLGQAVLSMKDIPSALAHLGLDR
ncbi:MAG TPA: hypothetical protein VKN76_16795 [Kiloniellaceae bacterium]|nr:hypothetical protein [Kiloniellaceae bacterium]